MYRTLLCLLALLPLAAAAQTSFRFSTGIGNYILPDTIPGRPKAAPVIAFSLQHHLSPRIQVGLSAGWTRIRNSETASLVIDNKLVRPFVAIDYFVARNAFPLTAELNYLIPGRQQGTYVFVGVHAGMLITSGSREPGHLPAGGGPEYYAVYYRNTDGFTRGGQLGLMLRVTQGASLGVSVRASRITTRLERNIAADSPDYTFFKSPGAEPVNFWSVPAQLHLEIRL